MQPTQKELLNEFLTQWQAAKGITVRTSGSTGTPKEIVLPHSQLLRSASRSNKFFGITKSGRLHSAMSFQFIGGKMMIARSLVSGCQLTYSEPSLELEPIGGERDVNLMCLVPAQLPFILENLDKFQNIKGYLIGGSAIDDRLWDRIVTSGLNAWESYGMTETATHVAMRRICGSSKRRPLFVPLPGVKISLGEDKSIHIQDGDISVTTTDLASMNQDGTFEIIGRKDDIINSGGIKILPQEVEQQLLEYIGPFCQSFYISSVPHIVWTSKLILVAVPSSPQLYDIKTQLMDIIQNIPEKSLPRRFRPKDVIIVDQLPRTQSGKLNRRYKFEL